MSKTAGCVANSVDPDQTTGFIESDRGLYYFATTSLSKYFNRVINMVVYFSFSYVKYSEICAKVVRDCLKPELKLDAIKSRGEPTIIKATKWEGGKPTGKNVLVMS